MSTVREEYDKLYAKELARHKEEVKKLREWLYTQQEEFPMIKVSTTQFATVMLNKTKLNSIEISRIADKLIELTKGNKEKMEEEVRKKIQENISKNEEFQAQKKYNDDTTGELAKEQPFFIVYYVYDDKLKSSSIDPYRRFPDIQSAEDAIQEEMQRTNPKKAYIFKTHSVYKRKEPVVCINRRDF
jgi:hypothetical protein